MKKKQILLLLSSSLLFFGCTPKTITVFEDKPICYELEKSEKLEKIRIRIYKADKALFDAKNESIDKTIAFYEKQIDDFNEFCKTQTRNANE
ncbi:hypothetical protein [Aliarcobacter butzleri]|uniref:hypothetical protein n=1 Tax=Aliarcobacter butzleri TaxID=28197 RepID=UPI0015872284|nr:hypothetical protein [Aliarcobacter butzleri]NUW29003.1 hypothetical protein [Aliarcobacter butzleri]